MPRKGTLLSLGVRVSRTTPLVCSFFANQHMVECQSQECVQMRVISKARLKQFWESPGHQDAEGPLQAWYAHVSSKSVTWHSWGNVKADFASARSVPQGHSVSNAHCVHPPPTQQRKRFSFTSVRLASKILARNCCNSTGKSPTGCAIDCFSAGRSSMVLAEVPFTVPLPFVHPARHSPQDPLPAATFAAQLQLPVVAAHKSQLGLTQHL